MQEIQKDLKDVVVTVLLSGSLKKKSYRKYILFEEKSKMYKGRYGYLYHDIEDATVYCYEEICDFFHDLIINGNKKIEALKAIRLKK